MPFGHWHGAAPSEKLSRIGSDTRRAGLVRIALGNGIAVAGAKGGRGLLALPRPRGNRELIAGP